MPKRLSTFVEEQIIYLYKKEMKNPKEIGESFGIDRNTVRSVLKRNNIKLRGKHNILDQANYIIAEYNKGRDAKSIAKDLGTYNTSIRRVLKKNSIPLRNQSDVQRKLHENPFKDISDQIVQYWIGYIAADGNISRDRSLIRLNCGKRDLEHLEKYADWLGNDVKVQKSLHSKYRTPEYCVGFTLSSAKETLLKVGITPAKSRSLKIYIPLTWHFVRGIFDGDGCISYCSSKNPTITFSTGSFEFASQLISFFVAESIFAGIRQNENTYIISISTKSYEDFKSKLYFEAKTYLERKYLKFI